MRIVRRRWIAKQTVPGSWGCGKRDHEAVAKNRRVHGPGGGLQGRSQGKAAAKHCCRLNIRGMICCRKMRRCRRCHRICRVCKSKFCSARKSRASELKEMTRSGPRSRCHKRNWRTMRRRFLQDRSKRQSWRRKSKIPRREEADGGVMHLSQICVASTQSSCSSSSLWENCTQTAAVSPPWGTRLNISGTSAATSHSGACAQRTVNC